MSEKESSSDISSDGEFQDATNLIVYDEDDSYINVIEQKRERKMVLLNTLDEPATSSRLPNKTGVVPYLSK